LAIAPARMTSFKPGVAATITIYTLASCDSCRKATKWLRARGLEFVEKPVRETPPSLAELRAMLAHQGGELRRLFNTAGQDYRAAGLKEKLPTLRTEDALALLAANGNLVKRPFLLGPRGGLVGFDESDWARALG
jgi:arsenate reductase